ncbi:MAG: hypothetical protein ABI589_04960 [Burkholderiales bacterium]
MATPNYGFEKRQKELAKKRKKEDKLKEKAARKHTGGEGDAAASDQESNPAGGDAVAGDAGSPSSPLPT